MSIDAHLSQALDITSGVPQGSILGSLMFIIFINDLPLHVKKANLCIYADDTTQSAAGCSIEEVQETLQEELTLITNWATNNKMALNKTKSMLICSKPKQHQLNKEKKTIQLLIDGNSVENVSLVKLLGLHLDSNLSWDVHVENTCKKIRKRLGLLKRSKKLLTRQARVTFYKAIIQPVMDYGACVWGDTAVKHADAMPLLQKRAARIITDAAWDAPSEVIFKELNIIPFKERVARMKAKMVFKALKRLAPAYISEEFTLFSQIHTRNTRYSSDHLILPKVKKLLC